MAKTSVNPLPCSPHDRRYFAIARNIALAVGMAVLIWQLEQQIDSRGLAITVKGADTSGVLKIPIVDSTRIIDVPIENNSDVPASIVGGRYSCSCLQSVNYPIPLPANSVTKIPLKLSPTEADVYSIEWFVDIGELHILRFRLVGTRK